MEVPPGHICVVQCGMRFAVALGNQESVHGYVLELYGQHLRLPDLGPIGELILGLLCCGLPEHQGHARQACC